MSNNIMDLKNIETANTALLTIHSYINSYDAFESALNSSKKFEQVAKALTNNEFLGLQINSDKNGKHYAYAFSSAEAKITPEDINWIFQDIASVAQIPPELIDDSPEETNRIYAFQYAPKETETNESGDGFVGLDEIITDGDVLRCYSDIYEQLKGCNASFRIIIDAESGKAGTVLISLPAEMPIRIHGLISMQLKYTKITEIKNTQKLPDDIVRFPISYLSAAFGGLLEGVIFEEMKEQCEPPEENPFFSPYDDEPFVDCFDEEFEDEEEIEEESGDESASDKEEISKRPVLIEDLELSIRSFNCLKRAGINTVEDITNMTEEELLSVRNLGRKSTEEIKQKLSEFGLELRLCSAEPDAPCPTEPDIPCYFDMLEELIGLENVKKQIKKIAALAKMKQDMEAFNKDAVPVVLNMEFVGNPGTAKTTVARILAGIFHEIGLLSSNKIVEVGRSELVGEYVGQTAVKVKSVFNAAKGKLLFIDEAYSLTEYKNGLFGDEAVNTIVQEMENNRKDTIVIFAGYPDKTEELFTRNPGLRSRVPFLVSFPDYSTDDMVRISELEAKNRGFCIQPEAREKLASICALAAQRPDAGNGRLCRNLVESAILNYALRVYGDESSKAEKDFTLTAEDFTVPENLQETKQTARIGFSA